jgi:anaerobic selenocysteine-containing dehydrogenase
MREPQAVQASAHPARDNLAAACVLCSHNCGLRVDVRDNLRCRAPAV